MKGRSFLVRIVRAIVNEHATHSDGAKECTDVGEVVAGTSIQYFSDVRLVR
jgi:hypothetical protein